MFGNYLKITTRKLYREKLYALINISGLAIAIACCVILGLYLRSELTYDRYHANHERIFRIEREFNNNGSITRYAITAPVMGPMLAEGYPVIEDYVRLRNEYQEMAFRHEDDAHYWENVFTADDNIFRFFTHDVIYGDPDTALVDPNSVAVSETFARTYFGDANPIGETISTDASGPRTITLVFADQPENSHVKYDVLFSYNHDSVSIPDNPMERARGLAGGWDYTYLLMPEGYDLRDYKKIDDDFNKLYLSQQQGNGNNISIRTWLTPLTDLHLDSTDLQYDEPGGSILYIYGFTAVAIFILLVACINYINMATARAARRAREVGLHKILGADRKQLIFQFLGESMFFAFLSLVIGIVLIEVALNTPTVTALLGKPLSFDLFSEPVLLLWLLALCLVIGILSGIYPAVYLSSMLPLSALVGGMKIGKADIRLREALVLAQFIISVGVIACTMLMAAQMQYVSDKALGFKKENQVMVRIRGLDLIDKIPIIRNELLKNNRILAVTSSPSIMGLDFPQSAANVENNEGAMQLVLFHGMAVADNFIEAMDMELEAGRSFSKKFLSDAGANYIVNETMVRNMGWKEPVGKRIMGNFNGRVIGVVRDFHFRSLHEPIGSFVLTQVLDSTQRIPADNRPNPTRLLIMNISGEDVSGTLSYLEEIFAVFDPAHPFEYRFLDDTLNLYYQSEQRLMKLTGVFAAICIFIACLGLFGLAAFTTEQRTKEIGVRKILGATTAQIIMLLSRGILILVLLGSVVASLVAWYAMNEWLAGFAYRTDINPLVFLLSAAIAAAIAFITLALQSFKTAQANPVQALRYE